MHEGEPKQSGAESLTEALAELISLDETAGPLATADVEQFVAARPLLAPRLQEAFADWRRARSLPRTATEDTWGTFLQRLASHAPRAQRYVGRGQLGRGGMGEVVEVWDEDLRRRLAMKMIRSDLAASGDRVLGRFLEEAQITAQLDHPGVVPVHELGVGDDGRVYFTMKLVKGHDLAWVLAKVRAGEESWSQTRAVGVLLKVCEAMAFAHSRGVIHRDLKPSNVMVGRFGEVYVMDWGLARVLGTPDGKDIRPRVAPGMTTHVGSERQDRRHDGESPLLTMDGDVIGTPAYMAPEQASGEVESLGPAADVYSIGAILYELLAGSAPHQQPGEIISPQAMLLRVQALAPVPLAQRAPDTAPELASICERAMARAPAGRYEGMAELAEDLRAYLENRVVRAHAVGPWIELQKWIARNRGVARSLAALLVVAVSAALAVAWLQSRRADEQRLTAMTQRADELVRRVDRLGPVHPDSVAAMQRWLHDVTAWLGEAAPYRAELAQIEIRGQEVSDPRLLTPEADELRCLRERILVWEDVLASAGPVATAGDPASEHEAKKRAMFVAELPDLRARVAELELAIVRPLMFSEAVDQLRWNRLAAIVRAMNLLRPPLATGAIEGRGLIRRVERDLLAAQQLARVSIEEQEAAWRATSQRVAGNPKYGGLSLSPQIGLVPIGPDPESGLEEFWHVVSGERPSRGADHRLAIGPATGIVLVLLAGGEFTLGAQKDNGEQPNFDANLEKSETPVRRVTLAPFFLAKFETTQGQWARATGRNPSARYAGANYINPYLVITRTHPVEHINWFDASAFVARLSLSLPTDAQMEYAIRGGTTTAYCTGTTADAILQRNRGTSHHPVDESAQNGFGLCGIMGNVAEWCRDLYVESYAVNQVRFAVGDGAVEWPAAHERAWRDAGQGWGAKDVRDLRSARRHRGDPNDTRPDRGVRAARPLDLR